MIDQIETGRSIKCQTCGVINWPTAPACMNCNALLNTRAARNIYFGSADGSMSFSQKVARFFEIVDYLLLLPAGYGLLASLALAGSAPWFPLVIITTFIAGCWLLSGFIRHSRGRLSAAKVSRLWYATIAYNLVELLILWVFGNPSGHDEIFLFSLWPLLVVLLSMTALRSESMKAKLSYD